MKEFVAYISYTIAEDWTYREKDKATVERLVKGRLKKVAQRINVANTAIDSIEEIIKAGEG